ncbi:F-box protein At5g06550 [Coccinella septempunctata]|uniref:F-box protein At5g06550 n=1 Tax=Coccinella septempunctata TaxID=41139 RepID=UPI001D079ADF|nr:F-box protein At5g06550 [Coccinella septempunctata]
MQKAKKRLEAILTNYKSIPPGDFKKLRIMKMVHCKNNRKPSYFRDLCLIEPSSSFTELFRPVESCEICEDVDEIEKINNVSSEHFEWRYVRNSRPVLVKDATKTWKAMQAFDFEFFKDLYGPIGDDDDPTCQFFPYKTEFKSLTEALNMSPDRAKMKQGQMPWYIGWSNCFKRGGDILRNFYTKPYFLSNNSETINLSWIFMGTPGKGAPLHVDNVVYPSWQAQIRGRKEWFLAPPPECTLKCKSHVILVEPGDIIVLDTNKWYHETNILPGEVSITIGAEFD